MSMWEEEKIQNDKVRKRKKDEQVRDERIREDREGADPKEKYDDGLKDRLRADDQDVDNGTSAWTAVEKDD